MRLDVARHNFRTRPVPQSSLTSVSVVAHAMESLLQSSRENKPHILRLQQHLAAHLYRNGFCVSVQTYEHSQPCEACDGTGYDYKYACPICTGSGHQPTEQFYRFSFDIYGRQYVWDIPATAIDFPVTLSQQTSSARTQPSTPPEFPASGNTTQYESIVYAYLRQNGVGVWELPASSFFRSLRQPGLETLATAR